MSRMTVKRSSVDHFWYTSNSDGGYLHYDGVVRKVVYIDRFRNGSYRSERAAEESLLRFEIQKKEQDD